MATEILTIGADNFGMGAGGVAVSAPGEGEGQSLVTSFQVDHPGGAGAENRGA